MQEFRFPVGRMVGGNIYRSNLVTEVDGKTPKLDKAGQKQYNFSVGVAFEKKGTTHWAQTEWGAKIWAEGHAGFPNGEAKRPDFAWKVQDGDSMIPNKRGKKPAENEGYPGHWVVWFSGTFAPKTCNANGSIQYTDAEERIKPGHFVQVYASVKANTPSPSPGVYMNYLMIAHSGFGPEIATGSTVDSTAVGFGSDPLPAGASAVPLGMSTAGAPATPPAVPGAPAAPPAAPVPPSSAPPAITPNPDFLNPATGVPQPPAPPTPPAQVTTRKMTGKGGAFTYEQLIAAGWNDQTLIEAGYMTP